MGVKVGITLLALIVDECILGAVYAATGPDGEQYAIKMIVWEESTRTTMRLRHPTAVDFLNELELMMELKPHSRYFVEFYGVDVAKVKGLGKWILIIRIV
jgi:hypothetical protein